jgi:hypothetical protein
VPEVVRDEIARTKTRFPEFGLKKVRDFLRRFQGVSVSTGTVARTLEERGIEPSPPLKKRRRKSALPRRFERARPSELWQSDITSFVLSRPGTRVYLVAFVDDFSRYVSASVCVQMRAATVCQGARDGGTASRGGLTDRVHSTSRGRKVLSRAALPEGFNVVAAGIVETINREECRAARPEDSDARGRHSFAHNPFAHIRGSGCGPILQTSHALRKTDQTQPPRRKRMSASETPRSVYSGQVGREVSVVGEREMHVRTAPACASGWDSELGRPVRRRRRSRMGSRERDAATIEPKETAANGWPAEVSAQVRERRSGERGASDLHPSSRCGSAEGSGNRLSILTAGAALSQQALDAGGGLYQPWLHSVAKGRRWTRRTKIRGHSRSSAQSGTRGSRTRRT